MLSGVEVYSGLWQTKEWAYIEARAGQQQGMLQDLLLLVHIPPIPTLSANRYPIQLFGGSAFAKEYLYKLTDYNTASYLQNFIASIAGASASLIVSAPLDVIKTRIQNRNFENPESGFKIVGSMMKNEGITSFFKGLTPKLLMTGPKLVFSFWLAQTLIPAFDKVLWVGFLFLYNQFEF